MAANGIITERRSKRINGRNKGTVICPCCGHKTMYKIPRRYEHCRYCGLYRILLPGQDF